MSLHNSKGMTLLEQFCYLSLNHRKFTWDVYIDLIPLRNDIHTVEDLILSVQNVSNVTLSAADFIAAEKAVELLSKNNVRWTTPENSDYPSQFLQNRCGPLFVSYLGQPIWDTWNWIGVVGSRAPFRETMAWLDMELPKIFQMENWSLLSGGARGVDQKAHSICIRSKKPTLCVIPSGLGVLYPPELSKWMEPILRDGGCLLSGFSYEAEMNKSHFHIRNRWLARLSKFVLVAQAARKSGSAMTGRIARDMFEETAVLPCSPLARQGLGGLDLIFDGAIAVRDAADLKLLADKSLGLNFSKSKNSEREENSIHHP